MSKLHILLASSIFALAILISSGPVSVSALSGSDFKAGNIIDDSLFFDGATMSVSEIQAFLNAKVPSCDTNGSQPYAGTTRAAYGTSKGYPPPYTCLRDYRQDTVSKSSIQGQCNGHAAGNKSAAEVIYEVAQSCGVSPKALIVLLEKEQSLISDDWPWSIQYRSATGYGCPDTAPCDAQYYGFFNQVYEAARQFKRYALYPEDYNHAVGRTSHVAYQADNLNTPQNENLDCGGTNVYMENISTPGLYNYTPYQPNQAALNTLYGNGDGCSAYGNRNFWRMYNDWFGTTLGSYLLRSVENATVYLVSDGNKYPIANGDTLGALYPLGQVKFVSQQYLDQKATGGVVNRLIRAGDGTIYFFDAGIKLPFTSCEMIAHYGYTCSEWSQLNDIQIQKMASGPIMTQHYKTTSEKTFYISNGQKREVFDEQARQENGLSGYYNTLNEPALAHLSYGVPLIRDGVAVFNRTGGICIVNQTNCMTVSAALYNQGALHLLPKSSFDKQSVQMISSTSGYNGLIRDNSGTNYYVVDSQGKAVVASPGEWSGSFQVVSSAFLNNMPNSPRSPASSFLIATGGGTIFQVEQQKKRPISRWDDLIRLNTGTTPTINVVAYETLGAIADGTVSYGPGTLVKYDNNTSVYMIGDNNTKYPLTSFSITTDLGVSTDIRTLSDQNLDYYQTSGEVLSSRVSCGSKNYVGNLGKLYEIDSNNQPHFGFTYQSMGPKTCATLPKDGLIKRFLVNKGTIYHVENGTKRGITSWQTYQSLGGNGSNTMNASDLLINLLPSGALL